MSASQCHRDRQHAVHSWVAVAYPYFHRRTNIRLTCKSEILTRISWNSVVKPYPNAQMRCPHSGIFLPSSILVGIPFLFVLCSLVCPLSTRIMVVTLVCFDPGNGHKNIFQSRISYSRAIWGLSQTTKATHIVSRVSENTFSYARINVDHVNIIFLMRNSALASGTSFIGRSQARNHSFNTEHWSAEVWNHDKKVLIFMTDF